MAWCTNPNCRKDGLRKADVEFCEDTKMILCHGCYALRHPGWVPPNEYVDLTDVVPEVARPPVPPMGFAFQFTEADGLKAQFTYGGASIAFMAPLGELKKLFGG